MAAAGKRGTVDLTGVAKEPLSGLIGRSLTHSFSVVIHRELGNEHYQLFEREPKELAGFFAQHRIGLLNVTIPYKQSVIPFCHTLSEEAKAIGSVNTIVRESAGLRGYNTDAHGFSYLAKRAGISFAGKKVLIFGSGGASLAVRYVAEREGAASVLTVSRRGEHTYDSLAQHRDAQILVNATPVGMYPASIGCSAVELDHFPLVEGVLDLVYNPLRTAFLMQAEERGIACEGGLPMLVAQAAAAEELFLGRAISSTQNKRILGLLLAEKENIVLIGMPGSGKSTLGKELAQRLGRELVDLDEKVEHAAGKSIPEIFRASGEAEFRRLESAEAARYGAQNKQIVVAGGGIVSEERNYAPLHQNGRIYHITRATALLAREGRPLSEQADLEVLCQKRAPLYERFRDTIVENAGTLAQAAEHIERDFYAYTRR